MAKYYYNRYYASYHQDYTTEYYYVESSWDTYSTHKWAMQTAEAINGFRDAYTFNEITGFTILPRDYTNYSSTWTYTGGGLSIDRESWYETAWDPYQRTGNKDNAKKTAIQNSREVPSGGYYYQGSFIDTLIAEDGTYPNNGRAGSYWYVKGAKATNMSVNIGGVWKDADPYVLVNGIWKTVDVSTNISGTWKS